MSPQCGHAVATDGCRIYYEVYGQLSPSSKVMVFQHGYTNHGIAWLDVLPFFLNRFTCVLIDGRGCGLSDKPLTPENYSVAQYTQDVLSVVDHLKIPKFTFLGHSMGGGVGMLLGIGHADRLENLVLVTPIPAGGIKDPQNTHPLAREERKILGYDDHSVIKRAAYSRTEFVDATPSLWKRTVEYDLACPDAYYDQSWDSMTVFNVKDSLGKIHTPTLMIVGSCDGLAWSNITDYGRLPNASLHVFSRASHYPHREVPADFAKAVLDFVDHGPQNPPKVFQQIEKARKEVNARRGSKL